jgi:ATP-dependent RNA helicase
MQEDIRRL